MLVIDHTEKNWHRRFTNYGIGGALTYSRDLVKYQIPHWRKILPNDSLISTCPLLSQVPLVGHYNTVIQYLHTYPYLAKEINQHYTFTYDRIIYISAYLEYTNYMRDSGHLAVYVPMSIDVGSIQKHTLPKAKHKRFLYFGNITIPKLDMYNTLLRNIFFDEISFSKFNRKTPITRDQILSLAATYNYGIAVGRAAQELSALGVKVLIAGAKLGGIVTTEQEYIAQTQTNMNGRILTHSADIQHCINDIDKSLPLHSDITQSNHSQLVQLCLSKL